MKNVLYLILLIVSVRAFGQKLDCKKFRDGNFIIKDEVMGDSYISRKGNVQTEKTERSELEILFDVEWTSECVYSLKIRKVIQNPDQIPLNMDMVVYVKIYETRKNSYMQRSTSNVSDMVLESEMIVVED